MMDYYNPCKRNGTRFEPSRLKPETNCLILQPCRQFRPAINQSVTVSPHKHDTPMHLRECDEDLVKHSIKLLKDSLAPHFQKKHGMSGRRLEEYLPTGQSIYPSVAEMKLDPRLPCIKENYRQLPYLMMSPCRNRQDTGWRPLRLTPDGSMIQYK